MAEKHFVVQGAICECKFSEEPNKTDKLKVKSQSKHFANDKDGSKKLIATDKEIGQTMEKNTFGKCKKQPIGPNVYNVCVVNITKWTGVHEKTTYSNKGKGLLEDSKATCPMGAPDCITIKDHGQTAEVTKKNTQSSKPEVLNEILPGVNFTDLGNAIEMIENQA